MRQPQHVLASHTQEITAGLIIHREILLFSLVGIAPSQTKRTVNCARGRNGYFYYGTCEKYVNTAKRYGLQSIQLNQKRPERIHSFRQQKYCTLFLRSGFPDFGQKRTDAVRIKHHAMGAFLCGGLTSILGLEHFRILHRGTTSCINLRSL